MTKSELRTLYKAKRQNLTSKEIEKFNDLILIQFQKIKLPFLNCVHTYLPSLNLMEADTINIVKYLEFKNPDMRVAIPKIDYKIKKLHHIHLNNQIEIIKNKFGIDEPLSGIPILTNEIDIVLVPLLAFDKTGFRVGYGHGYYDKFLEECEPGVLKIGLSFFEPEQEISDIDVYDIPLDYCVTPFQLFKF